MIRPVVLGEGMDNIYAIKEDCRQESSVYHVR